MNKIPFTFQSSLSSAKVAFNNVDGLPELKEKWEKNEVAIKKAFNNVQTDVDDVVKNANKAFEKVSDFLQDLETKIETHKDILDNHTVMILVEEARLSKVKRAMLEFGVFYWVIGFVIFSISAFTIAGYLLCFFWTLTCFGFLKNLGE